MTEHTHKPCIDCTSSDGFSYNDESGLFKCYVCEAKPSTLGGLCYDGRTLIPWSEAFGGKKYEEGMSLEPYMKDEYRGISREVLERTGTYFTEHDGKETVHWQYPKATKHKVIEPDKSKRKKKDVKISGVMDKFYGQDDYPNGGKTITITEGEEDRLSVIEMMGNWPTVSVPNATPSKAFWEEANKFLEGFDKIVLSVDKDGPGDTLAEKIYYMFPSKTYRVDHGKRKDANDFLEDGKVHEYKQAWWNAQRVKPDNILCTADDFLSLYEDTPEYEYFPTNIPELDKKMLGIHKGAVTLILAETGIGKTEFFRYLQWQALSQTDYKLATCHGEETPLRSMLGLVSYDIQNNVTRKDLIEEKGIEEEVKKSLKDIADKGQLYQFSLKVEDGVEEIINKVRFLAKGMEVDYIFIEPIQDFISAANTSEKESLLTDLTNKLKRLAAELNVGIVIIAHANKEGEAKYCASIVQGAAYEILLRRDPDAEDIHERNKMGVFVGRKNRTGNGSGPAGFLEFDLSSYMLNPTVIVEPKTPKNSKKSTKPDIEDEIPF